MLPSRSISIVQPAALAQSMNWSRISLSSADSARRRRPTSRNLPISAERSSVSHSRSGLISSTLVAATGGLLRFVDATLARTGLGGAGRHGKAEAAAQALRRELRVELALDLLGARRQQPRAEAAALRRGDRRAIALLPDEIDNRAPRRPASPWASPSRKSRPCRRRSESAPYLAALVASSFSIRASVMVMLAGSSTASPDISMRPACVVKGSSTALTTCCSGAPCQAVWVRRSWARDSDMIRSPKARVNSCGSGLLRWVCWASDWTMASVFLTRWLSSSNSRRWRCSAALRSVMSTSTPTTRSALPAASRSTWPRSITQRTSPSGRRMR